MSGARKRRWLRYSLRSLFAAMTIFGFWLGYEMNWIHQRHAALRRWKGEEVSKNPDSIRRQVTVDAPGLLWVFGEPGYDRLWRVTKNGPSDDQTLEREKVRRLFPEAGNVNWITTGY